MTRGVKGLPDVKFETKRGGLNWPVLCLFGVMIGGGAGAGLALWKHRSVGTSQPVAAMPIPVVKAVVAPPGTPSAPGQKPDAASELVALERRLSSLGERSLNDPCNKALRREFHQLHDTWKQQHAGSFMGFGGLRQMEMVSNKIERQQLDRNRPTHDSRGVPFIPVRVDNVYPLAYIIERGKAMNHLGGLASEMAVMQEIMTPIAGRAVAIGDLLKDGKVDQKVQAQLRDAQKESRQAANDQLNEDSPLCLMRVDWRNTKSHSFADIQRYNAQRRAQERARDRL